MEASRKAAAYMKAPHHIVEDTGASDHTIGLFARMQVVVSMRLHALVFSAGEYSMAVFLSGAFVTALPGIVIQLVVLPPLVLLLEKARLLESPYAVAA